jgi:hypothetical protein
MFKAYGRPLLLATAIIVSFGTGYAVAFQGHMFASLDLLKHAYTELASAVPNKGGHREAGLQFIQQAIQEVEEGIEFARAHGRDGD